MPPKLKRFPAIFYRNANGKEPAREWLQAMKQTDKKIIGEDIRTLEYGWPVGMPLCRSIAGRRGMWELRSRLPGNRQARLLFFEAESKMVLLHGFFKKTQETPKSELDLAEQRIKEGTTR